MRGAEDELEPVAIDGRSVVLRVPIGVRPAGPDRHTVIVDLPARVVHSITGLRFDAHGWQATTIVTHPLDGEGGGMAAGVVMERELVTGVIPHRLAILAPLPEGTQVTLQHQGKGEAAAAIGGALCRYGGEVVGPSGDQVVFVCERPSGASGHDPGPVLAAIGVRSSPWPLKLTIVAA